MGCRRRSRSQQLRQARHPGEQCVFIGKGIEEISLAEWETLVAVYVTGVFLGTRLAAQALRTAAKSSEHGSAIVNLASVAGIVGSQLDPLYSMTKGGG
jgi:NAD(P)-dependent dehydrogenase (short-subunit alcohol dehydrogenase family)